MPIDTISQVISTIPEAGHRGVDVQTQFVIKQEDFQDHLQGTTVAELNALKTQINTTVIGMNIAVDTVNTKASEASASASSASTSASTATTKASEASASASSASTSATKAGQWADNDYNVPVEVGKYSAKHWSVVAQNTLASKLDTSAYTASDVLTKLKTVDGIGSGLDADLLGGLTSSAFIRSTAIEYLDANNVAAYPHFIRFTGDTVNTPIAGRYFEGYSSSSWHVQRVSEISGTVGYMPRVFERANRAGIWTPWVEILTTAYSLTTSPLGYASGLGVGGTVTQATSKNTTVTLNKLTGRIVMANSALANGQAVTFYVNNSFMSANDVVVLSSYSYGWNYNVEISYVDAGTFQVRVTNISGATLSEALAINFEVLKGAIS